MIDTITLTGTVATDPRRVTTSTGLDITNFRLASTHRRFDEDTNTWVDGDTNWYTITTFRQLAAHTHASLRRGDRVIVTGALRIRDWEDGDKHGTTVNIDATTVGHDLTFGTSTWTRTRPAGVTADPSKAEIEHGRA